MNGQNLFVSAIALLLHHSIAGHSDPSQAPSICAQPESDSTLVAHEECNKFYKCSKGIPVAIKCPSNLLYNPDKEYCDWPENVNCNRNITNPNNLIHVEENNVELKANRDPSQATEICAAEGSDDTLIAHEKCNMFYECSEGKPVALKCPLNLLYNPDKEICDWPENVDCNRGFEVKIDDKTETKINEGNDSTVSNYDKAQDAAEICAAKDSEGEHVAHDDCNKFYVCTNNQAIIIKCPANLHYNPVKKVCDWPGNVTCNN